MNESTALFDSSQLALTDEPLLKQVSTFIISTTLSIKSNVLGLLFIITYTNWCLYTKFKPSREAQVTDIG